MNVSRNRYHLNPSRHCCQDINHQAGMLGIVARNKVAIHDQALAQVAGDDEASVEQQQDIQCEQKAYALAQIIMKLATTSDGVTYITVLQIIESRLLKQGAGAHVDHAHNLENS